MTLYEAIALLAMTVLSIFALIPILIKVIRKWIEEGDDSDE